MILSQMEITEGRAVVAYFHRVIKEDGKEIERSNPHTVCFMPDADLNAMLDGINRDITTREDLKYPPIEKDIWQRAADVCATVHTPEVKAQYEVWKQSNQAAVA